MQPAIAHIRVSGPRQGRSRLGWEAQQAAIAQFARTYGYRIAESFSEAETGKDADALNRRPRLAAAIKAARKNGKRGKTKAAPVIVAKLDRLSRDVAFISGLMAQKLPFIVKLPLRRRNAHDAIYAGADFSVEVLCSTGSCSISCTACRTGGFRPSKVALRSAIFIMSTPARTSLSLSALVEGHFQLIQAHQLQRKGACLIRSTSCLQSAASRRTIPLILT